MKLKCFNSLCKKYQNSDIIASTQNREKSKVSTENVCHMLKAGKLRAKKRWCMYETMHWGKENLPVCSKNDDQQKKNLQW